MKCPECQKTLRLKIDNEHVVYMECPVCKYRHKPLIERMK